MDEAHGLTAKCELNARLLATLKAAGGQGSPVGDVARSLRLNQPQLGREIERLEDLGFSIEEKDSRLRLVAAPDLLYPHEIREGLGTELIGRKVVVYDSISSTNDVAWELAADGVDEGLVVLAEEQTRGRGRMGRTWHSPRGGLWMSVLLRPDPPTERATVLTTAASVAVARAIRSYPGCNATIRWPNDILVKGKKVAGVLVETRTTTSLRGTFILGVGVNVNCVELPDDLRATATILALHSKEPIRRAELARSIIRNFDDLYLEILRGEYAAIAEEWPAMSSTIGRRITIIQNGRTYRGEVVDIDPVAGLMVRLDRGFARAFKGEHVTVVK